MSNNAEKNLFDKINCVLKHSNEIKKLQLDQKLNEKRKSELIRLSHEVEFDDHIIPLEELCQRLHTNLDEGLSPVAAKQLLLTSGPNIVTTNFPNKEWIVFLQNIFDWFNSFLWIGSLLCFITYITEINNSLDKVSPDNLYLGCALAGVVLISGSFSYYQQAKSSNIFITFRDLIPKHMTVIRAGSKLTCSATDIVAGDLVEIKAGDRLPADIRIIESHGLKCVNPLITGHSDTFLRNNECSHINPFETNNLILFSTNCVEGTAQGLVIRTGNRTLMSQLLTNFYKENPIKKSVKSPLTKDIAHFIQMITIVSIFFGLLFSSISYYIGYTWLNAIIFMIALIVAQIPEGLFPTLTVVLTLAAKRMTEKNCLVKNLETVETLGLTSMIVTDKTGILTQNKMIVSHIWVNNSVIDSESFYRHLDGKKADLASPAWRALIRASCLCNRAEFSAAQAKYSPLKKEAIGNSTEVAILRYMEILVGCVEGYRDNNPKIFEIAFNPKNKYSLTISKSRGGLWLCMKGAPELIIDKCSTMISMGKVVPFDQSLKLKFIDILEELGNLGERVIAFCDKFLPYNEYPLHYLFDSELENYPTNNLRFLGLISLLNPPRPSVPDAVTKCRSAGIKIVMITGDHPITTKAIARAVGIIAEQNQTAEEIANRLKIDVKDVDKDLAKASLICGDQLEDISDLQLNQLLNSDIDVVFARTSPLQKSRIVKCCRTKNSIITVTGDGGQSSWVVGSADISIAMGITGSDISKQSADIILLDDNFATIVVGIEEGRVIFDNLKKSICYTLSSKTPVVVPFILYLLLDIPLALGSITILCIDLGCDMIPAVSLAYELPECDIMKHTPRDPIINKLVNRRLLYQSYCQLGMFELFAGFFTYAVILIENGFQISDLFGIRKQWDSIAINDLIDSYGQEWSYKRRKELEYVCQTAFFAAIVITKWSALLCCKTRKVSLITQKMKNDVLTFSMFFELGLALFLSYCPGLDKGINMYPLKFFWWFCSIPFAVLMIIYEEFRKFLLRRDSNGWLGDETNY